MIYKKCFQSTFESLSVAGLTGVGWESVPGFGGCNAEGSLAEFES